MSDINNNYTLVKAIHLYIDSPGGDALAGQVGYCTLYPDEIIRLKRRLDLINRFDSIAYKSCMNLDDAELSKLSESEYFRKNIDETEAGKLGLISNVMRHIQPGAATFYILDQNEGAK